MNTKTLTTETQLKRYIVRIAGYGQQVILAKSLAHLLIDLETLRSQGLGITIICEDKRKVG